MAELTQFQIVPDANMRPESFAIRPSKYVDAYVLVADTVQTITIPTGARFALFSCTGDFYVDFAGTLAAVPAANITDGSAPELNPAVRSVEGYTSFKVIASDAAVLTIGYFN